MSWNVESNTYEEESDSFAGLLNGLITQLALINPPSRYHDSEDRLAEYVQKNLNWGIHKVGARWVGADYNSILRRGSFDDEKYSDMRTLFLNGGLPRDVAEKRARAMAQGRRGT